MNDTPSSSTPPPAGRATRGNPAGRFERLVRYADPESAAVHEDNDLPRKIATLFLPDTTRSLLSGNDSPDIPFRWSMNPYRGCEHGCAYCYARPSHEYLGLGAGLDFETRILVKHDAANLLRAELARPGWQAELIALSGNTDCYQPAEREFRLTRSLLEVVLEAHQPVTIITKNALVTRDLDLLSALAEQHLVHVAVSLTTLDANLARRMEPRTATPAARLEAIRRLADAGVPTQAMLAPIIPGLNDAEIPSLLQAAQSAGATAAGWMLLRLPLAVEPIFREWLSREYPDKQPRVEALIRSTRAGRMSDSQFGRRGRGQGPYAAQIAQSFRVFAARFELDRPLAPLDHTQFRPPRVVGEQMQLF